MSVGLTDTSARLKTIREALPGMGLHGVLISDPDNRFYVSGYLADDHGITESSGVVAIGPDDAIVFTGPNNLEWAASEALDFSVEAWGRPWETTVAERLTELGWERIGYEPYSISAGSFETLRAELNGVEFVSIGPVIDELRWVKEDAELDLLQRSIDITDGALSQVIPHIVPGTTEREIASLIESSFLELGADGAGFATIVGSGPNGARPHHRSGERVVQPGEPIVIDMGARKDGYCADLTRTVSAGKPSVRAKEIFALVFEAHQLAIKTVGPGVIAKDVDLATRELFEQAGKSDYVLHSVGHGLGIRVHDGPSLNKTSETVLEPGHVVTIEPGLYIANEFGVRIEDVVVVTDNGCRILSKSPIQLDISS